MVYKENSIYSLTKKARVNESEELNQTMTISYEPSLTRHRLFFIKKAFVYNLLLVIKKEFHEVDIIVAPKVSVLGEVGSVVLHLHVTSSDPTSNSGPKPCIWNELLVPIQFAGFLFFSFNPTSKTDSSSTYV